MYVLTRVLCTTCGKPGAVPITGRLTGRWEYAVKRGEVKGREEGRVDVDAWA